MSVHRLEVFADYFQFVLLDDSPEAEFPTVWTPEALELMLAAGERSLSVGTLRNVNVTVEVHVLTSRPVLDFAAFDHVAETWLTIRSGQLTIMGCTDYQPDAQRIAVPPGDCQLLFAASGIDTITAEWEPAQDLYSIYLWPGEPIEPRLIKHWKASVVSHTPNS